MQKASLSNKVFTENPLLDEIVYNIRQIATGVILKDQDFADNNETTESITNGDVLVAIKQGYVTFNYFTYDFTILYKYYGDAELATYYAEDNSRIPEADRPKLLKLAKETFEENYFEYNDYYRMLHGEPDYDEDGIWEGLWIDTTAIVEGTPTSMEYISKFQEDDNYELIHKLSLSYQILLYENGTLENIVNSTTELAAMDLEYSDVIYLLHIGERAVEYYDARIAEKFALLYCPTSDSSEVQTRFKDLFEANRLYLLYTSYSEAYKYRSDYYDNFMMIFIIIQTMIDMIVELPEYIIRRDIFDARTCKYIFEANGVKYFKDIPLKYQVALVKNLNRLIKFKSTDKCIVDIVSLFGSENIEVFKYYILRDKSIVDMYYPDPENTVIEYKNYQKLVDDGDGTSHYEEDNDKNYELRFIKVPLEDEYDNYIRTNTNIYSYDSIVEDDSYWVGDKDYDTVKKEIKDLDFTILKSKYYSIEAVIDLTKRNFTLVYFMNILMYNKIDKSSLKLNLPNISTKNKFELLDTIITLYSLSYIYFGVEDTILDSRAKIATILGFNMEADLSKIASWLDEHHKGLTLKDLHIDEFMIPDGSILSYNELQNIFFKNKDIYEHVRTVMANPPSKDIYDAYKYVYKSLFIMNRNMEYFVVGDNPVIDHYRELGYEFKFIDIPRKVSYYCPQCHSLVNLGTTKCPTCDADITELVKKEYSKESDYERDWEWFMESLDTQTLYFVIGPTFDTNHKFDLYIKSNDDFLYVGAGRMAQTYREFLKYKDNTLYSYVQNIASIPSAEDRQEACVNAIQTIISYMKDYIDQDGTDAISLDTVFSNLPSISLDFIKQYVTEVIDFFKSFKIFTHGSSIKYVISDKYDNYIQLIDKILLKYLLDKSEIVKIEDFIEGKVTDIGGVLVNIGNGLGISLSKQDQYRLIDKVWFSIDTWVKKNYNEYYDSDKYSEYTQVMREFVNRYSTFGVFDSTDITDALTHILLDLQYDETYKPEDVFSSVEETREFDDYYNEWMADVILILLSKEFNDTIPYQDDMTNLVKLITDQKLSIKDGMDSYSNSISRDDYLSILDTYYSIITQDFPAHA